MNPGLYSNPRGGVFTSALFAIAAGSIANVPHGLAGRPQFVHWVFVCTDTAGEAGYQLGDEVDVQSVIDNTYGGQTCSYGRSASHVFLSQFAGPGAANIAHKTTGASTAFTAAKWKARCYAQHIGP